MTEPRVHYVRFYGMAFHMLRSKGWTYDSQEMIVVPKGLGNAELVVKMKPPKEKPDADK